jgi:hypothetical protein
MRALAVVLLLLFSVTVVSAAQQDTGLVISKEKWQELIDDADYRETYLESDKKTTTDASDIPSWSPGQSFPKYIVYFLLFGVLVYLSYRVLKNFSRDSVTVKDLVKIEDPDDLEEKIHDVDLQQLLKESLEKKNFRSALRINFLIIIKLLSEKEKIIWARQKTNWEYYYELKDKLLADQYKILTQHFEEFWYGEQPFSELHYRSSERLYLDFHKYIAAHE